MLLMFSTSVGSIRLGAEGLSHPSASVLADFGGIDQDQTEEGRLYQQGAKALDARQWDRAITSFRQVVDLKGSRADGALYWTAWALNKKGNRAEALSTLDNLKRTFPKSRWVNEGRALETEIRQLSGQSIEPDTEPDDDLKLIAINSLMNADEERAIPMLEKFLNGTDSAALKERALFVLAQSDSPRARAILGEVARGGRNPDLQEKALNYLGVFGSTESLELLQSIYTSTTSPEVKKRILQSFMVAGERDRLLAVATTEQSPEIKGEAVRQLGVMGASDNLWQLYQKETSNAVKRDIIQALFIGGSVDRLIELAKAEADPGLRVTAIHNLGLVGGSKASAALVSLYGGEKAVPVRKAVVQALFLEGNAKALVDLARKETDPQMRKEIVSKLSLMNSKEATDYLMELLVK